MSTRENTESRESAALILAAGAGTRMKSALPKVLHEVAGRPMVAWAVHAAREAGIGAQVLVLGHGKAEVEAAIARRFHTAGGTEIRSALQAERRGTGDAARCGLERLDEGLEGGAPFEGEVVILYGDVPLLEGAAIERLLALREEQRAKGEGPLAMLTFEVEDPSGYGRILRDAGGALVGIREHRDCSEEERAITECNPGLYAADAAFLREALGRLEADNEAGELYLTDIVAMAAARGPVASALWPAESLHGVNDRAQLAEAEALMRRRILLAHMRAGVGVRDPGATYIDAEVKIAPDAQLEPGVVLRGHTQIGPGAHIDVGSVLTDVKVEGGAKVLPYTVATSSVIGREAQVGPFTHLRPGSDLGDKSKVGNFVEVKKTRLGEGAKASHLSYLGDGEVGPGANIGAGTIFCNYDGFHKHTTVIEAGAFIGSDSQLVAPVRVGEGAYVGTGTTVTKDVPAGALAIGRARQVNKEGYAGKLKALLAAKSKKDS